MKKLLLIVLLVVAGAGCMRVTDPATGETGYSLKPEWAAKGDNIALAAEESVGPFVALVSALQPAAAPAATGLGVLVVSLAAAWKKWRGPLLETQDKYDKAVLGLKVAADVIETSVKPNKALWEEAKPKLVNAEKAGATMPDKV